MLCFCHFSKFDPAKGAAVDRRPGAASPAGAAAGAGRRQAGRRRRLHRRARQGRLSRRALRRPPAAATIPPQETTTHETRPDHRLRRRVLHPGLHGPGAGAAGAAAASLSDRHRRAPRLARARQLADVPRQLQQLGLQPAEADQREQRRQAQPGLGLHHRHGRGPPVAADRQRRLHVRHHPGQPGDRARRQDRQRAVALQVADPVRADPAAPDQPRRRPLRRPRLSSPPSTATSSRSTPRPASRSGAPRSASGRTATT